MNRRIFLHGKEGNGWSIDADRAHVESFLRKEGLKTTSNLFLADAVHSVWWSSLLGRRNWLIRLKSRILATATNQISPDDPKFQRLKGSVALWVAPSRRQLTVFSEAGVRAEYQPFRVDGAVFHKLGLTREEIAEKLGLPWERCSGRFLIGSFQRDTLGKDLVSPKWQKGPDTLLEILTHLPGKDRWLLLLAGPRRHYMLSECRRRGIPYLLAGREPIPGEDDMASNSLSQDRMALLYNLIHCYVVSSVSEGGPKAIPEAMLCGTAIISTDVGFASDFLPPERIYNTPEEGREMLAAMMDKAGNPETESVVAAYLHLHESYSEDAFRKRWFHIYHTLFEGL